MRFEQLKCLQEIAKTGSISSAAKNLFVSQQALSTGIKQLEAELGVTLMMRSPAGISLTAEGREAVQFAQQMLQEQDIFLQKMKYRQEHRSALEKLQVNICSTSSVINNALPRVLRDLNLQIPQVSMHVSLANNSEEVMCFIRDDVCNIGLVTLNEQKLERLCKSYDLEYEILARDEIVGVMDRRTANFENNAIGENDFSSDNISLYNIEPIEEYSEGAMRYISISNDINFHERLMTEMNATVLMPNIAARQFFGSNKYTVLPFADVDVPVTHAVIYHRTISKEHWDLVGMIRKEMVRI